MKNLIFIFFTLALCSSCFAQNTLKDGKYHLDGKVFKFKTLNNSSGTSKDLVTVSTLVNAKQPLAGNGIHFTLVVKNNANIAISLKNIVNQLTVGLYNDRGLNISIPNRGIILNESRRAEDRKWRFRSETVVPDDRMSINGRIENNDIKKMEFIDIPAGGEWKINLIIKNIKQVETKEDVQNRILKPSKSLSPGKYKLTLSLLIALFERNKSTWKGEVYNTPFIDIEYN